MVDEVFPFINGMHAANISMKTFMKNHRGAFETIEERIREAADKGEFIVRIEFDELGIDEEEKNNVLVCIRAYNFAATITGGGEYLSVCW